MTELVPEEEFEDIGNLIDISFDKCGYWFHQQNVF